MARLDDLEARVNQFMATVSSEFGDLGEELRWSLTRALIHRAVHYAAEGGGVEFCALASYLGDMVGHGHKLMHGDNPKAPVHREFVH
jgi:hypothetical protein